MIPRSARAASALLATLAILSSTTGVAHASTGQAPQPTAASGHAVRHGAVRPMDAVGCTFNWQGTNNVCISVYGSGLHVDSVTASEDYQSTTTFGCGTPYLWANGQLLAYGNSTCGRGQIDWYFPLNIYLPDQTQLCVKWSDSGEVPCETVHS